MFLNIFSGINHIIIKKNDYHDHRPISDGNCFDDDV